MKIRKMLPLIAAYIVTGVVVCHAAAASQMKVVIFSGQNNHDWRKTTPFIQKVLEKSGRFMVDVNEHPESCTAESLSGYDIILSNWNSFGGAIKEWPETAKSAFLDFVRKGGGHVVVHAGGTSFPDWKEYHELIGATWGKDTGHGSVHGFDVTITDGKHPVTEGIDTFNMVDELWHKMAKQPNIKVLATALSAKDKGGSGDNEPVVMVTEFGKGRCFNIVLGHDLAAMSNHSWKKLLLRGTEWSFTGKVTIMSVIDPETALKDLSEYKYGGSNQSFLSVQEVVSDAVKNELLRKNLAMRMAVLVGSNDIDTHARKFLCEQLSLIGSSEEVPVLIKLLDDKDLNFPARFALERIPGKRISGILRDALKKSNGSMAVGLINSLAARRDADAVKLISGFVGGNDTAAAAIDALGKIGGGDAVKILLKTDTGIAEGLATAMNEALLYCAMNAGGGDADKIYERLLDTKTSRPEHVRRAAMVGLIKVSGSKSSGVVMAAVMGQDVEMARAALTSLKYVDDDKFIASISVKLQEMPLSIQADAVKMLAQCGKPALPGIEKALESKDETVREAAIYAIGKTGNAGSVALLASKLPSTDSDKRKLLTSALTRITGEGVDTALISVFKTGDNAIRVELADVFSDRMTVDAVPVLLEAAASEDRDVRKSSMKALVDLAGKDNCPALIKMLSGGDSTDARAIENALVAVCRRDETAVADIASSYKSSASKVKVSLVNVLGKVGRDQELEILVGALNDDDVEIRRSVLRALANWQNAKPIDKVVATAKSEKDAVAKALALRAFIELSTRADKVSANEMMKLYDDMFAVAERPEDKQAIVGGMGNVGTVEMLKKLESLLGDESFAGDAGLSIVKVARAVQLSSKGDAKSALEKVLATPGAGKAHSQASELVVSMKTGRNIAGLAKASSPDDLDKDGAAGGDMAAIDGNKETYWDEADGKGLYCLRLDWPQEVSASSVKIVSYAHHSFAPKDFDVICDGKVVKNVKGAVYDDLDLFVVFEPVKCKSLELKITAYYGGSPAIRELEVFEESSDK